MLNKLDLAIFTSIFLVIILFAVSTIMDTKYEKEALDSQIITLEKSMKSEYKKRLKESVNNTIKFIDAIYEDKLRDQEKELKEYQNTLNKEFETQFLKEVKNYFYTNIYDKTRYSWVNKIVNFKGGDNYAIRLIHPNLKKTEGSFLTTKAKDIKGNSPYQEELEGVKKDGEIYFTYYFKQLNSKEITEKLSYAKLYKKLNWVIATGIPLNTLNRFVIEERKHLETVYQSHLNNQYFFKTLSLIVVISILLILRKKLRLTLLENKRLNEKLEQRLENVETSLNKFFELPLNILVVGKIKGEILQINSGWKEILGFEKDEILNKNILDFVHPNDIEDIKLNMQSLQNEEMTLFSENRVKTKSGKYKTLAWSVTSVPSKDLVYAVAQDISELKDKTNMMYQQSKMAAIGEMTANIAHQWRQPLSIISTASSGILLKKMADDLDDKFLIDTLNQITQSTKYLSDTIEDFRNFYAPQKDKEFFNLKDIIDKTLNLIKKRFENYDIEIITSIKDVEVFGYENELLQVLLNITNNAKDQLSSKEMERKLIFINTYEKDEKIHIEIIDNGNGIDESIINRIFEPYFTTKDKSMGTGIGLYMSEEIVTKHLNGKLLVENHSFKYEDKSYKGAKFTIILR